MARNLAPVSNTSTFGVWLQRTNDLISELSTSIITASVSGDTTIGNAVLTGTFDANTVIGRSVVRTNTIDTLAGNTSPIDIRGAVDFTSTTQIPITINNSLGPRIRVRNNNINWLMGLRGNAGTGTNAQFIIGVEGGDFALRINTDGNIEVANTVTATNFNGNANTATILATSRTIEATGDISWSVTFNGANNVSAAATVANNAITSVKFRQSPGLSLVGRSGATTGDVEDIVAGADHQILRRSGTSIAFGALALNQSNAVTGTLPVTNGGVGVSTLTANKIVVGNNASGVLTPNDLHWDSVNNRLGVGLITPTERIDVNGNVKATLFMGTATSANYADLAEKYIPDADYTPGTVVIIGGENEITASQSSDDFAIGVISENPAFMMNTKLEGGVYVALKGRVPVKTVDNIEKGDILIPGPDGHALKGARTATNRFAVAITKSQNGYVEAVIL